MIIQAFLRGPKRVAAGCRYVASHPDSLSFQAQYLRLWGRLRCRKIRAGKTTTIEYIRQGGSRTPLTSYSRGFLYLRTPPRTPSTAGEQLAYTIPPHRQRLPPIICVGRRFASPERETDSNMVMAKRRWFCYDYLLLLADGLVNDTIIADSQAMKRQRSATSRSIIHSLGQSFRVDFNCKTLNLNFVRFGAH
ncbi:hypothetical protein FIBSPDRAFT_978711 [Athelia psychrophila]|uniref:Uncharacterized protein n=1 Tax=Athelia psychrophila TaxID=1759441 RepID=A0A166TJN3_9AGAM|nr:hypothetical protein FIBSPDRAFT_978711 [Fibularhizoctonia sp. CBS 109695]